MTWVSTDEFFIKPFTSRYLEHVPTCRWSLRHLASEKKNNNNERAKSFAKPTYGTYFNQFTCKPGQCYCRQCCAVNTKLLLSQRNSTSNNNNELRVKKGTNYTEKEWTEIKILITNRNFFLYFSPYCRHRSVSGSGISQVRNHINSCSKRTKQILGPLKISTLEQFVTFPIYKEGWKRSQFYKIEAIEEILIQFRENKGPKMFICSHCEKWTKLGNYIETTNHMNLCNQIRKSNQTVPLKVSSKQFVTFPLFTNCTC